MHARQVDFNTAVKQLCERANITYPFGRGKRKLGPVVAVYEYKDESGRILFANRRHDPKTFTQAVPDNNGGYISKRGCMNGVRRVLFGLRELLAADTSNPILLVEGEKDVLAARSLGFVATTPPQGADKNGSKWPSLVNKWAIHEPLKNRVVWIIPDNDEAGREHAQAIANTLHGFAASVKILNLPGLTEKGDLSDFIERNGPEEAKRLLLELAEKAPEYEPDAAATGPEDQHLAVGVHLTDMGNTTRFHRRFGDRIRHCVSLGWLVYDDRRWAVDDRSQIQRFAKKTVRAMYAEAARLSDEESRKALAGHAVKCEAANRIEAMIKLLPSEPGITVRHDAFDRDPMLFNCLNGTVDLRTGKLLPHDPGDLMTKIAPVEYDPAATAPRWEQFILEIMNGNTELAAFLRRLGGYSTTGLTREQVWGLFVGGGGNGKGTFIESVLYVMGDYATGTPPSTFILSSGDRIRNDLAALRGARFVAINEFPAKNLDAEILKAFTGEDTLKVRFLHREFFDLKPCGKLWFSAQQRPPVRDTSHGFWRRPLLIPFYRKFSGAERDPKLRDTLKREGSGILNWLVQGCLEWQRDGLQAPELVRAAVQDYRNSTDILAEFFETHCDFGQDCMVAKTPLYEAYLSHCEDNKIRKPLSKQRFNEDLRSRDGISEGRDKNPKTRTPIWTGIALKGTEGTADNVHYLRTCRQCDNEHGCPVSQERRDAKTCANFRACA